MSLSTPATIALPASLLKGFMTLPPGAYPIRSTTSGASSANAAKPSFGYFFASPPAFIPSALGMIGGRFGILTPNPGSRGMMSDLCPGCGNGKLFASKSLGSGKPIILAFILLAIIGFKPIIPNCIFGLNMP